MVSRVFKKTLVLVLALTMLGRSIMILTGKDQEEEYKSVVIPVGTGKGYIAYSPVAIDYEARVP